MTLFNFGSWVSDLIKARGHRYIKRIPYMSGGKRRYRYIYKVTHTHRGKRAFHEAHLVQPTAYKLHTEAGAEFHGHITAVKGDQVTYRIDDGDRKGESVTVSKSDLLSQLNEVHDIAGKESAEREKLRSQIEIAKQKGSEKQVKRLEERLARLGGEQKRAEPEPKKKRATRKKKRTTSTRGLTGKTRDIYDHLSTNPESVVWRDLTERLDFKINDIRDAINVLNNRSVTSFIRHLGGKESKIVSLDSIRGLPSRSFSDDRHSIGVGYSKLDGALVLFVRRGDHADSVGVLLPISNYGRVGPEENEALAMLAMLQEELDLGELNEKTDINDLDSIKAFADEVRSAYDSILTTTQRGAERLALAMTVIQDNKEDLSLEYYASKPYEQSDEPTLVDPTAKKLARGADMSEGERKKLARSIPFSSGVSHLDYIIHHKNIVGRTDGKRVHFRITEDVVTTPYGQRYNVDTGKPAEGNAPPLAQVIPESAPTLTLSRDTIKHLTSVLSSFKKKSRGSDTVYFTHNNETGMQEIRVVLEASKTIQGSRGEVVASIPAGESPDTAVDLQFLKDALKLAGGSASITLGGASRPMRIDAESGIHSVIMPKRL